MIEFISALPKYIFLQHAVLACLLASIGCGIIGSFIVVKRIGFLTGGIAHSVLAGVGIAYFLEGSPIIGAIIAALICGLIFGFIYLNKKQNKDILISALWSSGMAIGIIFLSMTPSYNIDLMSYLFGNVLLITQQDIILMLVLDIVMIAIIYIFYKQFIVCIFDQEYAKLRGINTNLFYILLLCLISISVVLLIQLIGVIMSIALLTLPAAISRQYTNSLKGMFILSIIVSVFLTMSGLIISYKPDLPTGSVIVLLTSTTYFLSVLIKKKTSNF